MVLAQDESQLRRVLRRFLDSCNDRSLVIALSKSGFFSLTQPRGDALQTVRSSIQPKKFTSFEGL